MKLSPDSSKWGNDDVIEIGLKVEGLIVTANFATQGLIMTSCMGSISCLIVFCFLLVANVGLNDLQTGVKLALIVVAYILAVLMYLMRIYGLMASGQHLGTKVKLSRRALENFIIDNDIPCYMNEKSSKKISVLRERLETYQYLSPISPYSVFQLNTRTFCATLATIITYIIVLLKLRGVETSKSIPGLITVNETESN